MTIWKKLSGSFFMGAIEITQLEVHRTRVLLLVSQSVITLSYSVEIVHSGGISSGDLQASHSPATSSNFAGRISRCDYAKSSTLFRQRVLGRPLGLLPLGRALITLVALLFACETCLCHMDITAQLRSFYAK